MAKDKKKMNQPEESKYNVVKVVPGVVHWGKAGVLPWIDWDLRTISEAEKDKLFEAGFEYLEKKDEPTK